MIQMADKVVDTRGVENSDKYDYTELVECTSAQTPGDIPAQHVEQIQEQHADGGSKVGESHLDEQVVQVAFVCMERGCALEDAPGHYSERIENGY